MIAAAMRTCTTTFGPMYIHSDKGYKSEMTSSFPQLIPFQPGDTVILEMQAGIFINLCHHSGTSLKY